MQHQKKISNFHRKLYWSITITVIFLIAFSVFLLYWNDQKNGLDFSETIRRVLPFYAVVLTILIALGAVFLKVMYNLGDNINRLNEFATKVDRDEIIEYSGNFSNNELGNISRHIVQIYNRLMQAKQDLFVEQERVLKQESEQVRIKRQLTQNIAHELKTPVTGIQGFLETIITNKEMEPETKEKFIEKAFVQCKRLSLLLHDITYLSRIDEAPEFIEKERANIASLISGVLNDLEKSIKEKKITIKNSTENQEIISYGSTSLLYSIFRNLVENTVTYAGEGVDIFMDCYKEDDNFYYFSYADNGVGVPEEHITRIFERFYRLDKGRSRKLGGTGLGLAIVKNAVLFHGGQITAKKYYGGGLEFLFTIKKKV